MQNQGQTLEIDLAERYSPSVKQSEFHSHPAIYKLYGGAMGGGKTGAIINEGIQLSLDYPGNYGLLIRKTSPSFRHTVLPQLEKFTPPDLVYTWNKTEKLITFINGSRLLYGGMGERPDDWAKYMSGEYGWIGLDQAEDFNEKEFRNLSTRLRLNLPGIQYYFLMTCNPSQGWLKELIVGERLKNSVFIPALPQDNQEHLPDDYIPRMRDVLGPNEIKALLEGDWEAVGTPDDVFGYHAINGAIGRTLKPGLPVELGIDVGWTGADESVIAVREGPVIRIELDERMPDSMELVAAVWDLVEEKYLYWRDTLGADRVNIKLDSIGVGAGVYDRLYEMAEDMEDELFAKHPDGVKLEIFVNGVISSEKATEPMKFKNLRAEIHWSLRELLDSLDLPDDRRMASELMAIKYKRSSDRRISIVPKEEIKKTLGRSPDRAEAVIYSVADVGDNFGFIEV